MPDETSGGLGGLFSKLRRKASDAIAEQEAAFVRGKVAGSAVRADDGTLVVDAGHRIDDETIERAIAAGKLHALAGAAVAAQTQDLRERASDYAARTPEGTESRSLGSLDDFLEARRYVGRIAVIDVTDIRGNVVVAAGTEIGNEHVRAARAAGLLPALIYSAQQPQPVRAPAPAPAPANAGATDAPAPEPEPPVRRATLPVLPPQPPRQE